MPPTWWHNSRLIDRRKWGKCRSTITRWNSSRSSFNRSYSLGKMRPSWFAETLVLPTLMPWDLNRNWDSNKMFLTGHKTPNLMAVPRVDQYKKIWDSILAEPQIDPNLYLDVVHLSLTWRLTLELEPTTQQRKINIWIRAWPTDLMVNILN